MTAHELPLLHPSRFEANEKTTVARDTCPICGEPEHAVLIGSPCEAVFADLRIRPADQTGDDRG